MQNYTIHCTASKAVALAIQTLKIKLHYIMTSLKGQKHLNALNLIHSGIHCSISPLFQDKELTCLRSCHRHWPCFSVRDFPSNNVFAVSGFLTLLNHGFRYSDCSSVHIFEVVKQMPCTQTCKLDTESKIPRLHARSSPHA